VDPARIGEKRVYARALLYSGHCIRCRRFLNGSVHGIKYNTSLQFHFIGKLGMVLDFRAGTLTI